MKTLLYQISFVLLLIFGTYFINNMEKFISIEEKDIIGTYKFDSENVSYKIILKENNFLRLIKYVDNNTIQEYNGTWSIITIGSTPYLDANISDIDNIDFSLGKIKNRLFFKNFQIEILSIGNFYGEVNGAFFSKEE